MISANETQRHPYADDYADIEAAWGDVDDPRQPFAFDPLAVAATEHVAAEALVEPLWWSLLGAVGVFVTAFGFCAWAAFGQTDQVWVDLGDHLPFATSLVVSAAGKPLMTFHADGRITVKADAKPDEAAKRVIEAMRSYFADLCRAKAAR